MARRHTRFARLFGSATEQAYPSIGPAGAELLRLLAEDSGDSSFSACYATELAKRRGVTVKVCRRALYRLWRRGLVEGCPAIGWRLTHLGWQVQRGEVVL